MNIYELDYVLEAISRDVDPEVQLQTVRTFLFIAMRGTCNQKDIESGLNLTNALASRNVSYWTDRRADRKNGFNFVTRVEDPYDRRYKILSLSDEGIEFLAKIIKDAALQFKSTPDGLNEANGTS